MSTPASTGQARGTDQAGDAVERGDERGVDQHRAGQQQRVEADRLPQARYSTALSRCGIQ